MQDKLRASLRDVRTSAAIISLFLSAWSVYLDDVVNSDGVLYLRTAELLAHSEWQAAFALYKWPFYAFLIAVISQITGLGFEYSAHVLNAAFTALAVVIFISLVRELGADKRTVIAAVIVVLLYPGLNEYRAFVIRDAGYIAFYLLAILLFLKDMKTPGLRLRLGWVASIFVATLFRIEGFVFFVALPLVRQWLLSTGAAARAALLAGSAGAVLLMLGALAWWSFGEARLFGWEEWTNRLYSFWQFTTANLSAKIDTIADAPHPRYERGFAYGVFFAALGVLLLWEVFITVTPLYAALAGHALYRRLAFADSEIRRIWVALVLLNLVVLAAILLLRLFLTGRFPLALSMTLLLAVPFRLAALYARWQENRVRGARRGWIFPLVCVLLMLTALDGLYEPTEKGYLKAAGLWLKDNTPAQARLISNDPLVLWYSGKSRGEPHARYGWQATLKLARSPTLGYDYLAVRVKRTQKEQGSSLIATVGRPPAAVFANTKGDKVLVFQLH